MKARAAMRTLIAVSSIALVTQRAIAEDTAMMEQFDINGNGMIDPEEATSSFLNYFNQIVLPGLQTRFEPVSEPLEDAATGAVIDVSSAPEIAVPEVALIEAPDVAPAASEALEAEATPAKYSHALLLRADATDSSIPEDGASLDSASGAFVSYANDVRQSTEEWKSVV